MSKPKGAGDLRDRIRFERLAPIEDGHGNVVDGWASVGTIRSAKLTPTRGGEQVQADRLTGDASFDLWVRSDSLTRSITTAHRVVNVRTEATYGIRFGPHDMDGRGQWLLFQIQSGTADG